MPDRPSGSRPTAAGRRAADDLESPNGHILTDDGRTLIVAESGGGRLTAFTVREDGTLTDRRTYAELTPARDDVMFAPPDGICLDAEGAVWVADPLGARVFRVREGGEVTDTIDFTDCIPVACVLGGADRRTLLMCVAADWKRDALEGTRTGRHPRHRRRRPRRRPPLTRTHFGVARAASPRAITTPKTGNGGSSAAGTGGGGCGAG